MIRGLSGTSLLSAAFERVFMKKNILVPKEQILYQILGSGFFRNERSKLIWTTQLIYYRYCIAKPSRHCA